MTVQSPNNCKATGTGVLNMVSNAACLMLLERDIQILPAVVAHLHIVLAILVFDRMPADPNCPPYINVVKPSSNADKSKQVANEKANKELIETVSRLTENLCGKASRTDR